MSSFSTTRFVDATPEATFDAFTDLRGAADAVRGIQRLEVLGEGPIGVGTRFRETRVMFKKEATEEMEITAFRRPEHYTVEADSCGARFQTTFRFVPEDGGTRVDLVMQAKPVTLMAKLMSPLSKLMMGACAKQFQGDLDDMAAVAEGRAGEVAAAGSLAPG